MSGPLAGLRVIEFASMGPAPFGAMVLADLGADVVRVDRPPKDVSGSVESWCGDLLARARRRIMIDLKNERGREIVLALLDGADVLIEGFRPGVLERLGLGPDVCLELNQSLVYARMTGWGQDGPLSQRAGHDLNFLALAGSLYPIGPADRPPPVPLNYIADFGGGGMLLVVGVLAALAERQTSGRGQVVDCAMIDGVALLNTWLRSQIRMGAWSTRRESNVADGAAPFYRTYECADGSFVAVAAVEGKFYNELLDRLGLNLRDWPQHHRARWPDQIAEFERLFATRTRSEWEAVFDGTDACVTPVLELGEAPEHPHLMARGTFTGTGSAGQPAPAPRFSRTPAEPAGPPTPPGVDTDDILAGLDFTDGEITALKAARVVV